jgi:hypothetical protein
VIGTQRGGTLIRTRGTSANQSMYGILAISQFCTPILHPGRARMRADRLDYQGPCSAALWMRSSGDLDESPVSRRDHDCRSVIVAQEGSRGFNFRGATIRWRS